MKNLKDYLTDNTLLIIPSNIKKQIIKYLNNMKKMLNIKILTEGELKKHLFFDYDEKTIHYLVNQNISYSNAKEILNNLYYIDDKTNNEKQDYLKNIYKKLIENNLLIFDKYFLKVEKNKEIIIFGFDYIDKFLNHEIELLKEHATVKIINKEENTFNHEILEFDHLNNEIEYIANDIIDKKLDLNHTYIYNINKDNEETIKRIFKNYNLPINFEQNNNLYDTKIGQDFLQNLDNYQSTLDKIENEKIKNIIINILNKYYFVNDYSLIKYILEEEFKNAKIPHTIYKNAINIIDIKNNIIEDDDYIYLIGFNKEYIPSIYKDTDYLNDNEKPNFLENTNEKNIIEKELLKNILKNIKNLTITYSKQNYNGSLEPSELANLYKIKQMNYKPSKYSNKSNLYNLAILTEKYQKTNNLNENLGILLNNYDLKNILNYNNEYKKINYKFDHLNLSYTKMNTFFECPFRYYCDYVLKLNKYEDTFDAYLGSLCHYILSKIYDKDFDFEKAKEEFIKTSKYELTNENKVFQNKTLNELSSGINYILSLSKINKYQDVECEKNIVIEKDKVTFTGIIDKIMKYNNNIVLIDYKTGNPDIDLRMVPYGLNLQLPTYIYLIKRVYPDSNIVGIYLQHILKPVKTAEFGVTDNDIYENNLKLAGYTVSDENLISDFDPTYENSEYIKSLRMGKNGFYSYSKILTKENFQKLEQIVEEKINECITKIENAEFTIEPKIKGFDNISCSFCPYKSVCFTNEKDNKIITLDQKLSYLGGEEDGFDA